MIFLVRHGQTEFNVEGRFQGALDSPLTAIGIDQARAYGRALADLAPDAVRIVSSPQGRARQTAELIAEAAGFALPIQLDPRLREITVGEWDGRLRSEIDSTFSSGRPVDWQFRAPGGETFDSMTARLGEWLQEATALDGVTIAVAHGMSGRILRGLYAGLAKEEMLTLDVPQDALFRLIEGVVQRFDCEAPVLAD